MVQNTYPQKLAKGQNITRASQQKTMGKSISGRPAFGLAGLLILAALFLALASPLRAQPEPELVIFHTSDVHGYALPVWDKNQRLINIGYPIFKAYVDGVAAKNKMMLDAGDTLSGRPFANIQRGQMVARILELLKYDAMALGNHDFDFGMSRLVELTFRYKLNFIAANIKKKEDGSRLFPPYVIKDYGGLKVGVFGLSTPQTPVKTNPQNVASLDFGPPAALEGLARDMEAELRQQGADLIIALTHLGTAPSSKPSPQDIARAAPGIDLIIDGHSHLEVPGLKEGNTLIVSAGAYFHNIGRVDVSRNARGNFTLTPHLVPAEEVKLTAPDQKLDALAGTLAAELDRELDQVVTTLPFALEGDPTISRLFSTNLGRIICAAMKRATGADAAIINSGSIRVGLPAGEVSRRQLLEVLPFENYVLTVRLSGAEIIEAVNNGLSKPAQGAFPQFYGMTVTAIELKNKENPTEGGPMGGRVDIIEIGGRPLKPEAEYLIATNDFLYAGGDGYNMFQGHAASEFSTVNEVFLQYLSETSLETLNFINLDDVLTVLVEE